MAKLKLIVAWDNDQNAIAIDGSPEVLDFLHDAGLQPSDVIDRPGTNHRCLDRGLWAWEGDWFDYPEEPANSGLTAGEWRRLTIEELLQLR